MSLLLMIGAAWVALAVPAGLLLGRGIRVADDREVAAGRHPVVPDFIPADVLESVAAPDRGGR